MKRLVKDVTLFTKTAGIAIPKIIGLPSIDTRRTCIRIISEEYHEYKQAESDNDIVDIADSLIDVIYTCVYTGIRYGLPLSELWDEVQKANMAKFPNGICTMNDAGKIIKPEGWTPPNIKKVLNLL